MEDCTILLQGKINKECLELWISNHKNDNLVLSVWEDENLEPYNIPKNWIVVKNQYPLIRFNPTANLDYQIITTLYGLYKINTKWVIKMRADEYWSNLDNIFDKMKSNSNKIVSGSMFFRKWGLYPFHCSDKILGSTVSNLIAMFESTLHNLEIKYWDSKIPECQLGLGWLMVNEPDVNFSEYIKKISKKEFNQQTTFKALNKASEIITRDIVHIVAYDLNQVRVGGIRWGDIKEKLIRSRDILAEIINGINLDDEISKKQVDERILMKKWFDIINIDELKPYIATRNFGEDRGRVWYRDDFDNEENDCLTDINQN